MIKQPIRRRKTMMQERGRSADIYTRLLNFISAILCFLGLKPKTTTTTTTNFLHTQSNQEDNKGRKIHNRYDSSATLTEAKGFLPHSYVETTNDDDDDARETTNDLIQTLPRWVRSGSVNEVRATAGERPGSRSYTDKGKGKQVEKQGFEFEDGVMKGKNAAPPTRDRTRYLSSSWTGVFSNINEKSEEFIRSRKEAMQKGYSVESYW